MSFDEQLQQAFDRLTERLRDHVAREIADVTDQLLKQAQADRERAAAGAASEARAAAERAADARVADAEEAALARVAESVASAQTAGDARVRQAVDEAVAAAQTAGDARVRQAVDEAVAAAQSAGAARARQAIDEAVAVSQSAGDARIRQAVDQAIAAAQSAHDLRAQQGAHEAVAAAGLAAGERLLDTFRAIDRSRSLSEVLDTLVSAAGREALRVGILLVRGSTLKGWRFIGFGSGFDGAHETELALDAAGVLGDAVRSGAAAFARAAGTLTIAPFGLPEGRERLAVPIPMSGQVVAVLYADQGPQDNPDRPTAFGWSATLDVIARHAAKSLEALTAFKAARLLVDRPDAEPAPASVSPPADAAPRDADPDDGDESARRYARLLVSEIKLYHEPAVVAGRRERDLGSRLGKEIARARRLYEQRVPAHVREHGDHFHAEVVRTLADGDVSLLGQAT